MKPLDYSLYNRVKEKFPPQPLKVIFVSLAPENIEKLEGIVLGVEEIGTLRTLAGEHGDHVIPYAVIGGFDAGEAGFYFACPEFVQEEDLIAGEIVASSIGTYHNNPVDIEAVKKEMMMFNAGILLSGNT